MYGKYKPLMKSVIAALVVVGLPLASRAATTQAAYSDTWAGGTSAAPKMIVGVHSCIVNGADSGIFNVTTACYTAHGNCYSTCFKYDAQGSHATVLANVLFNNKQSAIATLVMSFNRDGSSSEGVEIKDAVSHAILATTGRNAQGSLIELPVVKGSVFISQPAAP